jgi:hypothetical protein
MNVCFYSVAVLSNCVVIWKSEMVIVLIDTKLKTILGKRRKLIVKYPNEIS